MLICYIVTGNPIWILHASSFEILKYSLRFWLEVAKLVLLQYARQEPHVVVLFPPTPRVVQLSILELLCVLSVLGHYVEGQEGLWERLEVQEVFCVSVNFICKITVLKMFIIISIFNKKHWHQWPSETSSTDSVTSLGCVMGTNTEHIQINLTSYLLPAPKPALFQCTWLC